ncbi:MAG: serine--tRNA ligase [Acidimicrobiia bacterium]
MIDLTLLRDNAEYRNAITRKRVREGLIDETLAADAERRQLDATVEALRARQNAASKEIGQAAQDDRQAKIEAAGALKQELTALEPDLTAAIERVRELALQIPNPADASVPDGGEDDGDVLRIVGDPVDARPLDHAAYGAAMRWIETTQAVEMSGSRFAYVMREAALLELALLQWVTRILFTNGFTPVMPPVLVREHAMEEAGFFPTDRSQVYEVDGGELFLVGTSEVPLSAIHRGEILDADSLPLRYFGISSCFRREAGTYGKDTAGIFRVHQFDKVEMFSYADPASSDEEHEAILDIEETIVGKLGLPYRVVNIAAGDLGPAAAKKYDLEVWLPSEGRYRELTSCSNYRDYSARRLGTRVRGDNGNTLVNTLNGTACAIGRTLVFLFEHGQQPDGSFEIPVVLQPFMGGIEVIEPRT